MHPGAAAAVALEAVGIETRAGGVEVPAPAVGA